jgi:hypothetical protein
MKARTVRGWVVVSEGGWPFLDTVAPFRRLAADAYEFSCGLGESFKADRKRFGVQVVRCSISTEPKQ